MYIPVSQSPIGCRFIEDFGLVGRAGAAALCFHPGALDYSRLRRGRYRQLSHRTPVFPRTLTSSFSHRLPCNWVRHHESLRSMGGSSSRGRFQALIFLPRIRPCFPESSLNSVFVPLLLPDVSASVNHICLRKPDMAAGRDRNNTASVPISTHEDRNISRWAGRRTPDRFRPIKVKVSWGSATTVEEIPGNKS